MENNDMTLVAGYVQDTFLMALDDDYPKVENDCVVYIMDNMDIDDVDQAQAILNKIMGW